MWLASPHNHKKRGRSLFRVQTPVIMLPLYQYWGNTDCLTRSRLPTVKSAEELALSSEESESRDCSGSGCVAPEPPGPEADISRSRRSGVWCGGGSELAETEPERDVAAVAGEWVRCCQSRVSESAGVGAAIPVGEQEPGLSILSQPWIAGNGDWCGHKTHQAL